MTDKVKHASLAAALVAAQNEAQTLKRDAKNQHQGYRYASADQVFDLGRELLSRHGLAWSRLRSEVRPPALVVSDIGSQSYVGDVVIHWTLFHEGGATIDGSATYPVIAAKSRPHDKATAASVTYGCGQIITGLLCWDREDEKNSVDRRGDGKPEAEKGAEPRKRKPDIEPAAAPEPADSARRRARSLAVELGLLRGCPPNDVWVEAAHRSRAAAADQPVPKSDAMDDAQIDAISAWLELTLAAERTERQQLDDAVAKLASGPLAAVETGPSKGRSK